MKLELILTDEELKNLTYALKDAVNFTEVRAKDCKNLNVIFRDAIKERRQDYVKLLDKVILASNEYHKQKVRR